MWKAIGNKYTTILGIIAGIAVYLQQVGVNWPTDVQGWGAFIVGVIVAALGAAAKDGSTGSPPGATS